MRTKHSLAISLSIAMLASFTILACGDGNTLADSRDGKKYKTVKIGEQIWMAENLNYETGGSKCYDNDPANCAKYGRLYVWEDATKACPKGWHLPSDKELEELMGFVGGEKVAGKKLKAKSGWNEDDNGTDEFGFSALPGGFGNSGGSFYQIGKASMWWTATEYRPDYDNDRAYSLLLQGEQVGLGNKAKDLLEYVRCAKD